MMNEEESSLMAKLMTFELFFTLHFSLFTLHFSDVQNISDHQPDTIADNVKPYHILIFRPSAHFLLPLALQEKPFGDEQQQVGTGVDKKPVIAQCSHNVSLQQGVCSSLSATAGTL